MASSTEVKKSVSFESLLKDIGWGPYQWRNTVFAIMIAALMSVHVLSPIFISYPMPSECVSELEMRIMQECNETVNSSQKSVFIPTKSNNKELDNCKTYSWSDDTNVSFALECSSWANQTRETNLVKEIEPCKHHKFSSDGTVETSIVADFNITCERPWYNYLLQSVFMIGVFSNGLFIGKASDRIGRKNVILLMGVGTIVISFVAAFVESFALYIVVRGIVGFFCFTSPTTYVLVAETTMSTRRAVVVQLASFGFSVGTVLLVFIAFFIRTWKNLQIATSLAFAIVVVVWFFLDESPRWLISRRRPQEAMKVLRKIANYNNASEKVLSSLNKVESNEPSHADVDVAELLHPTSTGEQDPTVREKPRSDINVGMTDTLKTRNLRRLNLVLTHCWFATSCAFYGLTLNVASVGGNVYMNTFLMGILAVPAYAVAIYLCNKVGRRPVISTCFILAGLFCSSMYFIPESLQPLQIALFMIGRMFTLVPFSTLFLYTIELYPTILRSTAVNYGNSIARVGAAVAPAIAMLRLVQPLLPYVSFGLITLIAGIVILMLPETRKAPLCETMEEAEDFIKNHPGPILRRQ